MSAGTNVAASRDRITGLVLLAFGLVWSAIVYQTIPGGQGEGDVGARAFPLIFGIGLMVLSFLLVMRSYKPIEDPKEDKVEPINLFKLKIAFSVFALVVAYGFLLFKIGFLLATPFVVAVTMWVILQIRSPRTIAAMAIGITLGCWLVFGKLLGAYLPPGTWITII
ncbi:MAG: tripartite tricarboxylate transporter TctB family protein [Hyphomicrobiales bacterium]